VTGVVTPVAPALTENAGLPSEYRSALSGMPHVSGFLASTTPARIEPGE
jgi:hypothetical protein